MPRIGRLHIAGGCYHVMGRGLERRRIFAADDDKQYFLSRLGECLAKSEGQCLAWAIMSNHYHLLIRVGSKPLAKLMAPLLGSYAGYYNRRHRRSGYVFQNRYKSILCDEDSYLLELVRYIHLNPLKAGLVPTINALDRYRWTGHAGIMGYHGQTWQSIDEVLSQFAKRAATGRKRYREFIADGLGLSDQSRLTGGGLVRSYGGWEAIQRLRKEHQYCIGDERILGDSDFVEQALKQDEISLEQQSHYQQRGWTLGDLIHAICRYCEVDERQLKTKARANDLALAKSLICVWATACLGLSMGEVGRRLGISQPAVSKWVRQGEIYTEKEGLVMEDVIG
ncbi:MAG: transposase [Cellvibrionaceae bacterium]